MQFQAFTFPTAIACLSVVACGGGTAEPAPNLVALAPDCSAIQKLVFADTVIKTSTLVADGAVSSGDVKMPAHCAVTGEINPRTGVNGVHYGTNFELRLPLAWSGRFQFQGGGGVDGSVPKAFGTLRTGVTPTLSQGSAVVTSDMGHTGTSSRDATFGLDPQARIDWGYNSMDKVTVLSKDIITRFYGKAPQYSYYIGCSGGGRQGMMMSQRFPDYFDGVVSGAPILEQHTAQIGSMQVLQEFTAIAPKNTEGNPILAQAFSDDDLKLISNKVLNKCDALDGVTDGIIENYAACKFDAAELQCTGAKDASCLSTGQASALNKVMAGPRNAKGEELYLPIPWDSGIAYWRTNMLGTSTTAVPNAAKYTNQSIRYVFMTPPRPDFDYLKFDFETDPATMLASASFTTTNSPNYDGFKAHGAKALVYVGLSDSLINPAGVNRWYQNLVTHNGGLEATQKFARFFNVPGMGHCRGGDALDTFDPVTAIINWVEKKQPPEFLLASGQKFPGRSRPICAYPKAALYSGSGSVDNPANFSCR
jgi:feruloyl esterase